MFLSLFYRNVTFALLKLTAQIMLCLKLEYKDQLNLPLYYVMIPVWIILPVTVADVFHTLYRQSQ